MGSLRGELVRTMGICLAMRSAGVENAGLWSISRHSLPAMNLKDQIVSFLVTYGFQILGGIVIFACGFFLAQMAGKVVARVLVRFDLEPPIKGLIVTLTKALVLVLAAVLTVAKMGVDIAPLVAGMGVIGVGIGLATQGVLSNLVAGLTIMFVKPFRVGEYIELVGVEGVVDSIALFSTCLRHFDQSLVVIPNRKIVGEILHNYGTMRQLDLSIGVALDSSLEQTEAAIRKALAANPRILAEPAPVIGVKSLDNASICFTIKPWVKVADFVAAQGELYSHIVKNLLAAGIEIPFPQREIRILHDARGPNRASAGL